MEKNKHSSNELSVRNGKVYLGEVELVFGDFIFTEKLGKGAHATVLAAKEKSLSRNVAVKIWHRRSGSDVKDRARAEISKLAGFVHPLLVTVFRYGLVQDIPYAVMEHVPGETLKSWLKSEPSANERCVVWAMYSQGLREIYAAGSLHGDPHTGNIIIFPDQYRQHNYFRPEWYETESSWGLKLADTGSSLLWESKEEFGSRESNILLETASRIFSNLLPSERLTLPNNLNNIAMLSILDGYCLYYNAIMNAKRLENGSETVEKIVAALNYSPYFDLVKVYDDINEFEIWGRKHIYRRVSKPIDFDHECFYDDPFEESIIPEIAAKYVLSQRKSELQYSEDVLKGLYKKAK
jgi:serine/threonine protein kinase